MKPLKVTFEIGGYMHASFRLNHLDDLMAWLLVQENGGDWESRPDLPLESFTMDGKTCFKASAIRRHRLNPIKLYHSVRRTDTYAFAQAEHDKWFFYSKRGMTSVDTSRGEFKAYNLYNGQEEVATAVAYCVGDEAEVTRLLKQVRYLGKKVATGHGRVRNVTVEVDEDAHENWMYRHMPEGFKKDGVEYGLAVGRITSPYWHHEKSVIQEPLGWWPQVPVAQLLEPVGQSGSSID